MHVLHLDRLRLYALATSFLLFNSSSIANDPSPSGAGPTTSMRSQFVKPYIEDVCFETRSKQCSGVRDGCVSVAPSNASRVAMCNANMNACLQNADQICHPHH